MPKKLTRQQFLDRAFSVHGDKYVYLTKYENGRQKIPIYCPVESHSIFWQRAAMHLQGDGCPKCARIKVGAFNKIHNVKTNEKFLHDAFFVHGSKYSYLETYKADDEKMPILCQAENHGVFWQAPSGHLQGNGCPKCAIEFTSNLTRKTKEAFVSEANLVHNGKYTYPGKYINARTNMDMNCPTHGLFPQVPDVHLNGCGCPHCGAELIGKSNKKDNDFFLAKAKLVHNERYAYIKPYEGTNISMPILCKVHGEFWQTPSSHLQGHGCPKCVSNISKPEIEWLDSLGIPNDSQHRNCTIKLGNKRWVRPDGFIPETSTIYEFYGDYWHGNLDVMPPEKMNHRANMTMKELNVVTAERGERIKQAGYNLVFIWENDWKHQNKKAK